MVIIDLFSWWYGTGWITLAQGVGHRLSAVLRFFSVPMLLGSLFSPFRQISAANTGGPLGVQLRAWGDRTFSRFMGMIVRLLVILVGVAALAVTAVFGLVIIILWPLVPVLPVIGLLAGSWL